MQIIIPQSTDKIPRGLIAKATMQCVHPETGVVGDWLYRGDNHREEGTSLSPVFSDCVELFQWIRNSGKWQPVPGTYAYTYIG